MNSRFRFSIKLNALYFLTIIGLLYGYSSISLASEGSIGTQFIPIEHSLMGGYRCQLESNHVVFAFSIGATANTGTNMSYISYGGSTQHQAPLKRVEKTISGHFKFFYEGIVKYNPGSIDDDHWFDGHPMTLVYNSETNEATAKFVPRNASGQGSATVSGKCLPYVGGH